MSKKQLIITFDKETNAVYIELSSKKVSGSIEFNNGELILDVDKYNNVVGVEIL